MNESDCYSDSVALLNGTGIFNDTVYIIFDSVIRSCWSRAIRYELYFYGDVTNFIAAVIIIIIAIIIFVILADRLFNYFSKDYEDLVTSMQRVKRPAPIQQLSPHLEIVLYRIHHLIFAPNSNGVVPCIRLLQHYGHELINVPCPPQDYTAFLRAVYGGPLRLTFYMLKNGACITAKTGNGESALYLATYRISKMNGIVSFKKYIVLLHYLLAVGCDINTRNFHGCTPLHVAVKAGNITLVKWLLERGADCNIRLTRSLKRPVDIAKQYDTANHSVIANILEEHERMISR